MKRPAFQFYGGDWLRDPGLRACSLAARGLWMDMISIMSQVECPYGHLVFVSSKDGEKDGAKDTLQPILPGVLARMVGTSEQEVLALLEELEGFGVFSRTSDGVIYSRRMVRDEKVREARASGGVQSLNNPKVPRPKDGRKDTLCEAGRIPSDPSLGVSPASSSSSASSKKQERELEDFHEAWNELRGPLAAVTKLTAQRQKKLRARISDGLDIENFRRAVKICANTPFLLGKNDNRWCVGFDFLIADDTNLTKVLEGFYGNAAAKADQPAPELDAGPGFRSNRVDLNDIRLKAGIAVTH